MHPTTTARRLPPAESALSALHESRLEKLIEDQIVECKHKTRTITISPRKIAIQIGMTESQVEERFVECAVAAGLDVSKQESPGSSTLRLVKRPTASGGWEALSAREWNQVLADPERLAQCVAEYLPLVAQICGAIARRKNTPYSDELLQNGRIALFNLLRDYKPEKNRLGSYLRQYLGKRIDEIYRQEQPLRRGLHTRARWIEKTTHEIHFSPEATNRDTEELLTERLGLKRRVLSASRRAISAAAPKAALDELENLSTDQRTGQGFETKLDPIEIKDILTALPPPEQRMAELCLLGASFRDLSRIFLLPETEIRARLRATTRWNDRSAREQESLSLGLGYGVLSREHEVLGLRPSTWHDLMRYVDGLSFFSALRRYERAWSEPIVELVFGKQNSLSYEKIPDSSRHHLAFIINATIGDLNGIQFHPLYAEIFDLDPHQRNSLTTIAAKCVEHRIVDWRLPPNSTFHSAHHGGHRSRYFERSVVGSEERVAANLRAFVRSTYRTLDDIAQTAPAVQGLATLLDVGGSRAALARKLVSRGDLTPERPTGHPAFKQNCGTLSFYLDPNVVGDERARLNFNRFFIETYPSVDSIGPSKLFPIFLGSSTTSPEAVARSAIALVPGVSMHRPARYSLGRHGAERSRILSFFYDAAVIPLEHARENLRQWTTEMRPSSTTLGSRLLARAVNSTRLPEEMVVPEDPVRGAANRAALVQRGWMQSTQDQEG